jgi:deaminated glutathione amidase
MATHKVAAVQFSVVNDAAENLKTMEGYIQRAAEAGARLVLFPEFCNHPTHYRDRDHCFAAAIERGGEFIGHISKLARQYHIMVAFNVTVRGDEKPVVYATNHLVSESGDLLLETRKQVLMSLENDFFKPAPDEARVADTPIGRIGLMSCMDGLIPETARALAVKGADIILNSLSSNALDEAHLHIPVRAAENRVWVVAANRSGPIVDPSDLDGLIERLGIPRNLLNGGGESQIVAPDGVPVARAARLQDGIVFGDIALSEHDRAWPGGGSPLADRQPGAYGIIATPNDQLPPAPAEEPAADLVVATVQAACLASPAESIAAAVEICEHTEADLLVLPELFAWDRNVLAADVTLACDQGQDAVAALSVVARNTQRHVVVSVPARMGRRAGAAVVLLSPDGEVARYFPVHTHPEDRSWASAGEHFVVVPTPFGRVGLMSGLDIAFPESARVLARMGADLIAAPVTWSERWLPELAIRERVAENHVPIVAGARPDSPAPFGSMILTLPSEYMFPVTGEVNNPVVCQATVRSQGAVITADVDVRLSRDKRLMGRTDLLMNARPELYSSLVQVDATAARPYASGRRIARELGMPARLLRLTAEDGYPLDAVLAEPRAGDPVAAVIHLHGEGGNFYTGPGRFIPERTQDRPIVHLSLNMRFHDLGYTRDDLPSPDLTSGDVPVGGGFWEQISAGHLDVAAAVGFLRDQGHEQVFVLGHSSGGYYAVDYAARGGDITGLVLLSPLTTNRTALPRWFPGDGELDEALALAQKMIIEGRGDHLITLPSWYYAISARSLVERAADPEHAWEESLAQLKCQVLMLWGETESRHGLWSAIADRVGRPGVRQVSLPGCEHNYAGFEDQVTNAVADFVTGT